MNDLFSYPTTAGYKDGTTSKAAAESMAKTLPRLRAMVKGAFKQGPATADEIAATLDISRLAVRPRVTELAKQGIIAETGERRPNESGRSAKVWALAA